MKTKELVIAAYDKDLSWLSTVNADVKQTIYRKGNAVKNDNEIIIQPNVGRCVHSFFNHIYKNYNSLADYTFFTQDYPFDHWGNIIEVVNGEIENYANLASLKIGGYYGYHNNTLGTAWNMQRSIQFVYGNVISCLSNGHPQDTNPKINVDKYWDMLFDCEKPSTYEFMPGGHFAITKDHVKIRNKKFYKKIVDLLAKDEIAPWIIERLECYIFSENFKAK